MTTQDPTSARRPARWARLIAAATGLLALTAVLVPGAAAQAAPAFTAAQLATAGEAVRAADVGGTAWAVEPASGTVRVAADETVSAGEIARIERAAGRLAGALDIERVPGRLEPFLQGGEPIYADAGWRCAAGFNVRSGTTDYFVTAGHCTEGHPNWYANASHTTLLGPTIGSSFPGNDYGLVRHANTAVPRPGTVVCNGQVIDIIGARNPAVGEILWVAAPSGCRSGGVTGLNYTVNYGGGDIVSGLGRLNTCTEPGDSGAPVFTGNYAVGIISGGSGNCASGGTTFFQPILEILNAYGVTIT
ncbi:S1 family peptidase [Streptomyces litchfieldiae]|uniref:S1 family peptidase n=1 Tax=Streptomyces litchfieldiae TaxID=3075543 RepID=A0ABU2MYR0_9ACTN|nr:S1 family peptidase [Streptomyces sp. DSM 44938]MDT0346408.1 S1 family peptidase [Streptomyces sp. DSM 44938]